MLYNGAGGGFAFGSTPSNTSGINSTGPGSVFASQGGFNGGAWHPSVGSTPSGWSGGGGGGGGGNSGAIQSLLANQNTQNQANFNAAQNANIGNWQTGVGMLNNAQNGYNNSALTQGTRGLVQGLLNNPYSLDNRTQNSIMNRQTASNDAMANNQMRNTAGALAAGGQSDASSLAAAQQSIGRNQMASNAGTQANLGVQAALQRTQDVQNAARLGQQQNAQDFGVNFGTANSYLQNMYLQKPYMQDASGQIAALAAQNGGGGGGMGGMQQQQGPQNGFQMGNFHQAGPSTSIGSGGFGNFSNMNGPSYVHPIGGGTGAFAGNPSWNPYGSANGADQGRGVPDNQSVNGYSQGWDLAD